MVVDAVERGAMTVEEACHRYDLSVEEFLLWRRAVELHGVAGLRVTRIQIYDEGRRGPRRSRIRKGPNA